VLTHARGDGAFPDVPVQASDDAEQDRDRAVREGAAACGPAGVLLAEERRQAVDRPRLLRQRLAGRHVRTEVVLQTTMAHSSHAVPEVSRPSRPAATRVRYARAGALRRR